jgi:hypothetical protein
MVALLQRLGLLPHRPQHQPVPPAEDNTDDLTPDQIAYLHELAAERRKAWLEAERVA